MAGNPESSYWDRETLRDKLIELGLDTTDTVSFELDGDEFESLFCDYDTERDFYQFEFFMYLAQYDGLEQEVDEQMRRAFRVYGEMLDYSFFWGGFHITESELFD